MRRLIALLALIATPVLTSVQGFAADVPKGLWLLTDYPSQTVRAGEVANIRFKLQNSGIPPEPLALSVDEFLLAPVLSQPSLPFGVGQDRKRALGCSDADLAIVAPGIAEALVATAAGCASDRGASAGVTSAAPAKPGATPTSPARTH